MHDRNAGQLDNIPGLDGRRRPMAQRNATQLGQRLKETIPDYENARLQVAQALGLLAEDLPSPPQDVAMTVIKVRYCGVQMLHCGFLSLQEGSRKLVPTKWSCLVAGSAM